MAWAVWVIISPPNLGDFTSGIFPMINQFDHGGGTGNLLGILSIINIVAWGVVAVGMWAVMGLAIKAFRQGNTPRMLFEQKYGLRPESEGITVPA